MNRKTIHVGTITAQSLLKAPIGHQQHYTGTGAHQSQPRRQRTRSQRTRRALREWA